MVDVQLRRLDVQIDQLLKLPKHYATKYLTEIPTNQNDLILISVPISIIAMVPIAGVFHNGDLIGRIPLEIIDIDFPNNTDNFKKSGRKDPSPFLPPPDRWSTKYPYNTLPDTQYRLSWSSDSLLWSTPRPNSGPVVIPAYEILRAFYCFDPRIIEGLFVDHWTSFIRTLVDLNRSGESAPGTLDIFLLQPLQINRSVEPLFANLVTSHAGRQGAAGLHPRLIAAHQGPGSVPIDVPLPFDWENLTLEIAGIELLAYRKFLGLEIRGIAWGGPKKIVFHGLTTEKADTGADDQDEDREKGPPVAIPQVAVTDPVAIVTGMPNSLASIYVAADGPKWRVPPEIDHIPAARPQGSGPSPIRVTGEELTEASADFGAGPAGKAARVGYAFTPSGSVDPPAPLFDQLADALDDLVERGEVQNWRPISVTEGRIVRGVRAIATSDFSRGLKKKGRSWSRHASGHGRALFVAEIVRAGQPIYWLEIERRQGMTNEHFTSVVIKGPLPSPEAIVKKIIKAVRDKGGKWPEQDDAIWSARGNVQHVRHPPLNADPCFTADNVLAAISNL